jgi:CoA binding domain
MAPTGQATDGPERVRQGARVNEPEGLAGPSLACDRQRACSATAAVDDPPRAAPMYRAPRGVSSCPIHTDEHAATSRSCKIANVKGQRTRLAFCALDAERTCQLDIASGNNHRMAMHSTPAMIREVLTRTTIWTVVGCSPNPGRDSHRIARLLQAHGYRVIPVNPFVEELLGERCYPTISAIPAEEGVEVVDIFRRADKAGAHVDEAIAA